MQIPYRSYSIHPSNKLFSDQKELLRPVVDLSLIGKDGKEIIYPALVDSGADYSLFHGSIGEQIGLNVKKGKQLGFYGTSGRSQTAYFHEVTFRVQDQSITCWVGFCYGIESMSMGLLGQYSFFDKFKISFDLKKQIIELS